MERNEYLCAQNENLLPQNEQVLRGTVGPLTELTFITGLRTDGKSPYFSPVTLPKRAMK